MADVHNFISTALQEGHPIEDIVGFLGESDNPEEKAWAQRWQTTAAQPAYEAGAKQQAAPEQPNTSMLEDFSNLSTPAKLATGAGVLAGSALLGAGAYAGKKAIDVAADVRREKALSQIEPSAAVKVQQGDLALRQAQFEASRQVATTGEAPLSPVEQIKLEREKLRLEADRQKLAREAELHTQRITQMARQQELNEAKAQATAAKQAAASVQTKTASGAIDPAVKQMLVSSEVAKIDKAVEAGTKAAAKPPVVNAPIQPPVATVQLTPSAEVLAEPVTPVAKSAPAGTVPVESAPVAGAVPPKKEVSGLTKQQEGMKKHLVSLYGGGTEGEKAYAKVGEILGYTPAFPPGQGGGLAPEETKVIKAWRKETIAGPKVNLTHDMKKVMKGAGGIAVLAAIPGFAEAAQRKDFGAMTDIATDFAVLPFAQSREAGMPKAQEEAILASKFKESQKLGSPYRSVPPPKR